MRVRRVTETPIEFDKHRGMAAQKATDIRRVIAEVEANAKLLRDKQGVFKSRASPHRAPRWPRRVTCSTCIPPACRRPTPITATWRPRCLGTLPNFRGRDLNKPVFGSSEHFILPVRATMERPNRKHHDAKSLASSRHDRRIASSRCGIRLVLDQSQRNLRLGPAFFRSRLLAQDR